MENDLTAKPRLAISQWVIYDHPRDYPDKFVMRRWEIGRGLVMATDDMALADTLEEARAQVPAGRYRLEREADDDPVIVEMWL